MMEPKINETLSGAMMVQWFLRLIKYATWSKLITENKVFDPFELNTVNYTDDVLSKIVNHILMVFCTMIFMTMILLNWSIMSIHIDGKR